MCYSELRKEIADNLIERLDDYKTQTIYSSDLGFTLFESYNADGSVTYSRSAAIDWIKEYFEDLDEIVEEMHDNWDYDAGKDVFANPEKFMTCVYLYIGDNLINSCPTVQKYDRITLTNGIIKKLTREIEKQVA